MIHLSLLALSFTPQVHVLLQTAPRYVSHKRGRVIRVHGRDSIVFSAMTPGVMDGLIIQFLFKKRGRLSSSCKGDKQVLRKKKRPPNTP